MQPSAITLAAVPRLAESNWKLKRHLRRTLDLRRSSLRARESAGDEGLREATVHEVRVICRRTCEIIRLFLPLLPDRPARDTISAAKKVMKALAPARESDVALRRLRALETPRLDAAADRAREALVEHLDGRQERRERKGARRAARLSRRLRRSLRRLSSRLGRIPRRFDGEAGARAFLNGRITARAAAVRDGLAAAVAGSVEAVHDLRIAVKHLRYALQFAEDALGNTRLTADIERLRDLQDAAGSAQDLSDVELLIATFQSGRQNRARSGLDGGLDSLLQVVVSAREDATHTFLAGVKAWTVKAARVTTYL
jgi:CHAD domain-containing protein